MFLILSTRPKAIGYWLCRYFSFKRGTPKKLVAFVTKLRTRRSLRLK